MKHSLKVLFLTTSYPRFDGDFAGAFVQRFAFYLNQSAVEVMVLAPDDEKFFDGGNSDGVKVRRFRYYFIKKHQRLCYNNGGMLANLRTSFYARLQLPLFILAFIASAIRYVRTVDIVHCHWLPTVWVAKISMLLLFSSRPIVLTNWGSDTRLFPKWFIKLTLKMVSGCISTAAETDAHLRNIGYRSFVSIMAPVDERRFHSNINRATAFKNVGISPRKIVISFVGRLNYFKDPLTFIEACRILHEEKVEFVALMCGDGDLANDCRLRVEQFEMQDYVRLLGAVTRPEDIFAVSRLTVHISPVENTWANSIAEAMFVGCPVIMTDVGYTRVTFKDRENCILVKPGAPEALASAIKNLLANEGLAAKISRGAFDLLHKSKKDSKSITALTIDYYRSVLDGGD